jgi:hypothetical protein
MISLTNISGNVSCTCAQNHKVLDFLPGVRDVRIYLVDVGSEESEAFLAEASDGLGV